MVRAACIAKEMGKGHYIIKNKALDDWKAGEIFGFSSLLCRQTLRSQVGFFEAAVGVRQKTLHTFSPHCLCFTRTSSLCCSSRGCINVQHCNSWSVGTSWKHTGVRVLERRQPLPIGRNQGWLLVVGTSPMEASGGAGVMLMELRVFGREAVVKEDWHGWNLWDSPSTVPKAAVTEALSTMLMAF